MSHFRPLFYSWKLFSIALVLVIVSAASWSIAKSTTGSTTAGQPDGLTPRATTIGQQTGWSKALVTIEGMSCGGCIETIKNGLSKLSGIGDISINLSGGSGEIYFDADRIKDANQIAAAITNVGYPAKITDIVSPQQVQRSSELSAIKAKTLIASVGEIDISRQDYDAELQYARSRYEQIYGADLFNTAQGAQLLLKLKAQVGNSLVEESLKLQEVARSSYKLQPQRSEKALPDYLNQRGISLDQLKKELAETKYSFAFFEKKLLNQVKLQSYLEERILAGSLDQDERRTRYLNWLSNARQLANVTYYDSAIENLIKANKGGSCSGSGGGTCSPKGQ